MIINKIPVTEIVYADNSDYLFDKYFDEGKTGLTDRPKVNKDLYIHLDSLGMLDNFGIYDDTNTLVGFIIASTSESPHYGTLATTVMSVFILPEHRKYGAAKKLISLVERCARDKESSMVIISSPKDATMGKFITKIGYKVSNILYGKTL